MTPATSPSSAVARRRWLPTLAAGCVAALALSLGNWQLRRADEKRALGERAAQAATAAAIVVPAAPVDPAGLDGRRVRVRGRFVADRTVFVDNRTHKGVAGVHVATPVRIEGSGLHVLVLRGWIARDPRDRSRLPEVRTPTDTVEIEGIAEASLQQALELRGAPAPGPADRLWQNLSIERYAAWSGLPLQTVVVRQYDLPATDDGLVRDWPEPRLDVDKHLGYAFQWFALAAATAGLWAWFTFFRHRDDDTSAE